MKACGSCAIFAPNSERVCPKCGGEMSVVPEVPKANAPGPSGSGAGIGAVVLGGISLFLPFFAAVFLVPAALVCSLIALKNRSHGLGVAGLILSGLGAIGLVSTSSSLSTDLVTSSSATHRVTYVLTGTAASASITIENESGGTEQHLVSVPWSKEFRAPAGRFFICRHRIKGRADWKPASTLTRNRSSTPRRRRSMGLHWQAAVCVELPALSASSCARR